MKKSALVFGVSGQDGAYLAKLLLSKGYEVHGVTRNLASTSFSSLKLLDVFDQVKLYQARIQDYHSILQLIERVNPGEIYNLAGQSSVSNSFQYPLETLTSITIGTLNILEAVRQSGSTARVYNAGSSEAFGDAAAEGADELTPFEPKSPYGVAKSAACLTVKNYRESYSIYACSGLLFNHESLLRPVQFVTKKVASAAAKIALGFSNTLVVGDLKIERDWGWAPEYVEAMWLMMQRDKAEDFVVASGRCYSLEYFVQLGMKTLSSTWRVLRRRNFHKVLNIG